LYPLGILVGSSFIGALSDLYGRKRVLITSLLLAAAGYALTGYAVAMENYMLFAFARIITGMCEGNIAVSRAIALELHPVIDRTRAISLLYATNYAGWLIGPLAGGYLSPLGVANVFYIAGAVTIAAILAVQLAIARQPPARRDGRSLWRSAANNNSLGLLRVNAIRPLIIYHLLYALGLNAFYEFYPLWLVERFDFNSMAIGWTTVAITTAMIISSIYAVGPVQERYGDLGTVKRFSIALGVIFLLTPLANSTTLLPVFILIGATIAVANGVFPAYMANQFEEYGHGRVQGLLTTNFCAANVIIALAGSFIALLGTGWTLVTGGLLCACASLWLRSRTPRTADTAQ
jgi:MFS family permease